MARLQRQKLLRKNDEIKDKGMNEKEENIDKNCAVSSGSVSRRIPTKIVSYKIIMEKLYYVKMTHLKNKYYY